MSASTERSATRRGVAAPGIVGGRPWYVQFWPWVLIALPGVSVAVSVLALVLALRHADPVVGDDWYARGLAINTDLDRSAAAVARGVAATVEVDAADAELVVTLAGDVGTVDALAVEFQHPTIAARDRAYELRPSGDGSFRAPLGAPPTGRWYVTLAPASGDWRLATSATLVPDVPLRLAPAT